MAAPAVGGLVQMLSDINLVPNPPVGSMYVGVDLDGTLKLKDVSGVIYPVGGSLSGTPSFIPYFDSLGNLTGDGWFSRTNGSTLIGQQIDINTITGLNIQIQGGQTHSSLIFVNQFTGNMALIDVKQIADGTAEARLLYSPDGMSTWGYAANEDGVVYVSRIGHQFILPIYDGSPGQVITTDGSGNLTFSSPGGGSLPSGPNYQSLILDGSNTPTWTPYFYDLNGTNVFDWSGSSGNYWLRDGSAYQSLNWGVRNLYSGQSFGNNISLNWANRFLIDSLGVTAINWDNRNLLDGSQTQSINWQGRTLYASDGFQVIDWGVCILNDSVGIQSMNWNIRQFSATSSQVTMDWQACCLYNTDSSISVEWGSRCLVESGVGHITLNWDTQMLWDSSAMTSIDWTNRHLIFNDGTTISIDWQGESLIDANGNGSIFWGSRSMYDAGFVQSINYDSRVLFDINGATSVDYNNQLLLVNGHGNILTQVDWINGNLYAQGHGGAIVVAWESVSLADYDSLTSLNWGGRYLADSNQNSTIDWGSIPSTVQITAGTLSINTVPYHWPSSQGTTGSVLSNNGNGNLTWMGGGVPTIATGSAIGFDGTASIVGTNECGIIHVTTGTSPASFGTMFVVTLHGSTYLNQVVPVISPASLGTSQMMQTFPTYVIGLGGDQWNVSLFGTLTSNTTYIFTYLTKGY